MIDDKEVTILLKKVGKIWQLKVNFKDDETRILGLTTLEDYDTFNRITI